MNKSYAGMLMTFLTSALLVLAGSAQAQVYKTVDEDGNVTYTDQPPGPGAEPVELPGISVIESVPMAPPAAKEDAELDEGQQVTDIRELRRGYKDFKITSPTQDEYIQGTGNLVTIAWDTRYELQPGMAVIISLDGSPLEPTVAPSVSIQQVDRGEHTASARLVDADLRTIATASPVTFYVRQFSQNF